MPCIARHDGVRPLTRQTIEKLLRALVITALRRIDDPPVVQIAPEKDHRIVGLPPRLNTLGLETEVLERRNHADVAPRFEPPLQRQIVTRAEDDDHAPTWMLPRHSLDVLRDSIIRSRLV